MIRLEVHWNHETLDSLWSDPHWQVWSRNGPTTRPVWRALKLAPNEHGVMRITAANAIVRPVDEPAVTK
jgi:hypothetical protein